MAERLVPSKHRIVSTTLAAGRPACPLLLTDSHRLIGEHAHRALMRGDCPALRWLAIKLGPTTDLAGAGLDGMTIGLLGRGAALSGGRGARVDDGVSLSVS